MSEQTSLTSSYVAAIAFYIIGIIAIFAANQLLFELPNFVGFLMTLLAGLIGGAKFRTANNRVMRGGERFRFAFVSNLIMTLISISIAFLVFSADGTPLSLEKISAMVDMPVEQAKFVVSAAVAILIGFGTFMVFIGSNIGENVVHKVREAEAAD